MRTYEVLFVTEHGNGWAIVNSTTVSSVRSILENQSKFQPLNILHIKEVKAICGVNTSIIYEGHCETMVSPYDLAVSQGYEGSLEDWLESLKADCVQSDWNQEDDTQLDFIKNKPTIPSAINDLSDVDITSAANQNVLMYDSDSNKWKNAVIPQGVTSLSALSDVDLTSLANGQMLKYNSISQEWENVDIPSDAFICTLTSTTVDNTTTYSCDKTSTDIRSAANSGKVVLMKWSDSRNTVYLPINTDLSDYNMIIFGGLTSMGSAIAYLGVICIINNGVDVWDVDIKQFKQVAFSGNYNALDNLPTLGTAAALDVAESGNASATQVVKGDDTRLAAEVFVCTYTSSSSSVNKTPQEIYEAHQAGKIVICEFSSNGSEMSLVHCGYTTDNGVYGIRFCNFCNPQSTSPQIHYLTFLGTLNEGSWIYSVVNLQKGLIGSGTGQNIKTVNGNNLLGSGDVHISGDIMFLTATAGSNNTYRLPKTVQELVDLYDNGITVVVNVSSLLYYRISRSSPLFINITNDYVIRILYTVGAGSDASDTVWRINTRTIQEKLVSGTNIKTINNESILGSGDISITASGINAIPSSEKGANGGVAELDSTGKVPSSQLPSYVDDVLEYASLSAFPATGESGKIYVALDTNKTYRWSGSAYVEISESLALGETSSTAYAGNKGKANADAIAAIKDGSIIDSFADVEAALTSKQDTINSNNKLSADLIEDGNNNKVFTSSEKTKLGGIESGAQVNVKPDWNATSGSASEILNKPTIPAAQVNADWNASSGIAQILNKPILATVATSGNYNDLSNTPTIPDAVSGTNDGTNWTSLTIGSVTKAIPSGGGGSSTQYAAVLRTWTNS